ncbi:peptidoglycan glycosyltransferase [Candidatus Kryptobacter tengchongensis]|uniref:Peptidoglycan glycosyltransferase n=1 Tax=Kryptobacter tengchongensis TaxID=1643429 RepID=A0A656D7K7_KRYT1|nr:penicillin-binding protein 2 [Candidatus Kryptobacter tengchongensis]CUT00406.1 peptidoglycan glycosyltransferase [Candidatus Kryptobacter tengchongensis]CUU04709.1 peptidoglycan glycosyltransferase [Candidatus Kryptobacter tengchongensis]
MSETSRVKFLKVFLFLVFLFLIVKLYELQLYRDIEYKRQAESNSIRTIQHDPIRGLILDRNGKIVVDNVPSYTVTLTPYEFDLRNLDILTKILKVDRQYILEKISSAPSPFAPVKIRRDAPIRAIAYIEEHRNELRGVDYLIEHKRNYKSPGLASHILGYVKEITSSQLAIYKGLYKPGDQIGQSGLEKSYEPIIKGEKGYRFIMVDALGRFVGRYNDGKNDIPPGEGSDLILTIDIELQEFIEQLLQDKTGSVVVIDPRNGEILAMVSKPNYDLTLLSGYTPSQIWNSFNSDPQKPLLNRAISGLYSPGSTFKMILAVTALETGAVDLNWKVYCPGYFVYGNKVFKCHTSHGHGWVNLTKAIEVSCNVYFYNLMLKVNFDDWSRYGELFGFGRKTGVDLPEELPGILPSTDYFNRVYGVNKWTKGYLISLAIGQGEISATPLQLAGYAMALANSGKYHQPHLVKEIINKKTGKIEEVSYYTREIPVSQKTFDIVREAMYLVVNGSAGTGKGAKVEGINVAGKTGTAQNPHGNDHAWFIGFAPYENPEIAFAIIVENAGFGGAVAAPIAREIVKKYFELKNQRKEFKLVKW